MQFLIIIIIQAFVRHTMSANIPNSRHRQSLGEEDGVLLGGVKCKCYLNRYVLR